MRACEAHMTPQFISPILNSLLQRELDEGGYATVEDALVAGLQVLRECRQRNAEFADRLASLQDGRAIELNGDEELGALLDSIDAEVDAELKP